MTDLVLTCTGNLPGESSDDLCPAAVETCPTEGDLQFWVYRRMINVQDPEQSTDWALGVPAIVCLGPDDPAVDPAVAIPALVQRDFQRVVVRKGVPEVSPTPDTLVNIPTRFRSSTPEAYDIPLTLLGQSVVITARAQRWTWHFGDGQTATVTGRGSGGFVEHVYGQAADREAYVVIEWSGTFRVGGGPEQPITGTATTTGDPVAVAVRQARSELVDQSS